MSRLQAAASCTFEEFTDLVHRLLNSAWGSDWGNFSEAFPQGSDARNVKLPVITYTVESKTPGQVGKDGTKEIKPRFRETYDPAVPVDDSMAKINVYSQTFDYIVRFDVWEENNQKLAKIADRFEDFMMTYLGYFMSQGVGQLVFQKMSSGEYMDITDSAVVRNYRYLVRLERHVEVPVAVIREVITRVEVLSSNDDQHKEVIDFKITKGGNS